MSTFISIPPPLADTLENSRRQFYDQRAHAFEVFHYDLELVTGNYTIPARRVPWKRSEVVAIRVYAGTAGTGQFDVVVSWYDNAGGTHLVGTVTSNTASPLMVEAPPWSNGEPLVDPLNPGARFIVGISNFVGTQWNAVGIDVILIPLSR